MLDEDHSPENASVAAALEHPGTYYMQWAERPDVAHALSMFKSEREIRKTCRLDLVTWVQYICAFGYDGPSDEAWALLFSTCRVLPMLEPNPTQLAEHEIAVLLAYAKIKPDHCDSMTPAQLVKHRIKPAVLGRSVARTPGILQHIHAKFETWAFGPFTEVFCNHCVTICDSGVLLPAIERLPPQLADVGEYIRENADTHSQSLLKNWRGIITSVLGIEEGDSTSHRARRFEEIFKEKRTFMYQTLFIKLSEHYFKTTQSTARIDDAGGSSVAAMTVAPIAVPAPEPVPTSTTAAAEAAAAAATATATSTTITAGGSAVGADRGAGPITPRTQMRTAVKRLLCGTSVAGESEALTAVHMGDTFDMQKVDMFTPSVADPLQSVDIGMALDGVALAQGTGTRELDVLTTLSVPPMELVDEVKPACKRMRVNGPSALGVKE